MNGDIVEYLGKAVAQGASDLHLCANSAPMIRKHGGLIELAEGVLNAEACRTLIYSILTENQRARLEETWELDFAVVVESLGRFRANAYYSRGTVEAVFRYIPENVPPLPTLGLPPIVRRLC